LAWKVRFEKRAKKELSSLDRQAQADIWQYLKDRIATEEDPKRFGQPLRHNLAGLWKYRIGHYRVIADIQNQELVVLVVRVGHRKNVYEDH